MQRTLSTADHAAAHRAPPPVLRRGPRAAWITALVALLLTGLAPTPRPARAGEPPQPLRAKERIQRRSALRSAAGAWITHRARFPSRCPVCKGTGKLIGRAGRGFVSQPCKQCKAHGVWISPPDYRATYYDKRTEAFRRLPNIQDTLEAQYKEASDGRPWPTRIARYQISEWELVDDTHGIVGFRYNGARSPTATYWIWSTQARPQGEWCSYDSRSDGDWPSATESASPAGASEPTAWEAVSATEFSALRAAVAGAGISFRGADFLGRDTLLKVRLEPRSGPTDWDPATAIAPDTLKLVPLLLAAAPKRARVETEWCTAWRDADGLVRLKPTRSASLERAALGGRAWGGLDASERLALVTWREWAYEGWQRVIPGLAVPAPTEPPGPPPEPDVPTPPPEGPTPHPEPPPLDTPPPATPPPATPPPQVEPETPRTPAGPSPTLSASGRKQAEAGVARMKELLALARTASDEGVLAHQGGAHDLWQEKLNEARAFLGELGDVWDEQVLPAMPGGHETQREELANELFGSLWDEVYELKAVVRKTSAMR